MPRGGKIVWRRAAFEEIRRLPAVDARLNAEVDRIMAVVGGYTGDYQGGVEPGKSRSRGYVVTRGFPAIKREARDHTLLRAIGGGAGKGVYTTKAGKRRVATRAQADAWGGHFEEF